MISNMRGFIVLVVLIIAQLQIVFGEDTDSQWNTFKSKFGKKYHNSSHESASKQKFLENLARINAANANSTRGFRLGVNHLTDLSMEEFIATRTGLISSNISLADIRESTNQSHQHKRDTTSYPTALNYQGTGYVSAVKEQGSCGCCWAFTASQVMEGQTYRVFGKMISPSEQQLVDCDNTGATANSGCNGGDPAIAFAYMSGGITNEATYPFTAVKGTCQANPSNYVVANNQYTTNSAGTSVTGTYTDSTHTIAYFGSHYRIVDSGTSDLNSTFASAVIAALNQYGPLAIEVCAGSDFKHYSSGIFYNATGCPNSDVNHGVTLVGYNISSSDPTQQYWIVKNQWNTTWGLDGYIYIRYGANLIRNPSYPNINTTAYVTSG